MSAISLKIEVGIPLAVFSSYHLKNRSKIMIKANKIRKIIPLLTLLCFVLFSVPQECEASRLKDLASVKGVRSNQLVGYGLVVGLEGTGDGSKAAFTTQAMANMLENMGVHVNQNDLKVKNVAGVMITASLPPFVKIGQTIDVTLSSLGDADSLQGGTLVATPLKALDGKVYGMAQGPVSVGGFEVKGVFDQKVQKNHTTVGLIPNGATVEREVPVSFAGKESIFLNLNRADFTTVTRTVKAINGFLNGSFAKSLDGATVEVKVPEEYSNNEIFLIAALEELEIAPDNRARVIINERTGTVVLGGNVRIAELALTHGDLSISVSRQWGGSRGADEDIKVGEEANKLIHMPPGVSLGDLVKALNSLGATPRDLVAILQSIKASGALQAELEII